MMPSRPNATRKPPTTLEVGIRIGRETAGVLPHPDQTLPDGSDGTCADHRTLQAAVAGRKDLVDAMVTSGWIPGRTPHPGLKRHLGRIGDPDCIAAVRSIWPGIDGDGGCVDAIACGGSNIAAWLAIPEFRDAVPSDRHGRTMLDRVIRLAADPHPGIRACLDAGVVRMSAIRQAEWAARRDRGRTPDKRDSAAIDVFGDAAEATIADPRTSFDIRGWGDPGDGRWPHLAAVAAGHGVLDHIIRTEPRDHRRPDGVTVARYRTTFVEDVDPATHASVMMSIDAWRRAVANPRVAARAGAIRGAMEDAIHALPYAPAGPSLRVLAVLGAILEPS